MTSRIERRPGPRCAVQARRTGLDGEYRPWGRRRSPREVKDGTERGGARVRIPGEDARRAAELVTRRESRAEVGTDLSREAGLRNAWSAHADELYGFARRALGDSAAAEDALQETFVRAWRGMHRFDPKRDFATWLFVIARRAAANHFRARRIHDELSDELADAAMQPIEAAASHDDAARLWRAAKKLKPNYYEALWLRYGEGFSVAQAARVMGLTTIDVKVILHRARKELARHIKRDCL